MILVAGSTGLAGSAILRKCESLGLQAIGISTKQVDLLNRAETIKALKEIKPEIVIDAAARAGGIGANNSLPVQFLTENVQIQSNLMDSAYDVGVKKFVFLGSSCIYPRNCAQPIKEEYLLTGELEKTNSAYAVAKIAGIELIKSYRKQYKRSWISLMPTNLYGPKDNFNVETGHVIPALINKFENAKRNNLKSVKLWGSGSALREFMYVDDLADAVLFCLDNYNEDLHINVGTGEEISIRNLAHLVSELVGFTGKVEWDSNQPDGTPRKVLDSTKLTQIGWKPKVTLSDGLTKTIGWYLSNYESAKR